VAGFDPEGLLRATANEWRRRALVAEALLRGEKDPSPRDLFDQEVPIDDGKRVTVLLRKNLGCCSLLEQDAGRIVVEELQPDEGKAIGLFFQVLQLADMSIAIQLERPQMLEGEALHWFVPTFLYLAASLGLLAPELRVTAQSIDAYVKDLQLTYGRQEEAAASPRG
jgi:hypothetical protein